MTHEVKWKIAKWIKSHGETKRKDLPQWVPPDLLGRYDYFHVLCMPDKDGYSVPSPDDVFSMSDAEIDAYQLERKRRIHAFRDWLEPTGIIVANVIAIAALVVSIMALLQG